MDVLTSEYLKTIGRELAKLRGVGDAEFPLTDRYVVPEVSVTVAKELGKSEGPKSERVLAQRPAELSLSRERRSDSIDSETQMPLTRMFVQARHLVMLGDPGSGKTTALRFVGWCLTTEESTKRRLGLDAACVPILLDLKEFAEDNTRQIETALAIEVNKFLRNPDDKIIRTLVESWLVEGKVFALLDGLDEVPDRLRPRIRDEVRHFAGSEKGLKNRVLLAARRAGFTSIGEPFVQTVLQPFDGLLEVSGYVENWLAALRPDWTNSRVTQGALQLVNEMRAQPALHRIFDNALILRVSAEVFAQNGTVAKNRAELYRRYIKLSWDAAVRRGVDESEKKPTFTELEAMAWRLQTDEKPEELKDGANLSEKLGLLTKVGDGVTFSHQTFQEYFAAGKLAAAYKANREIAWDFLRPRLHLPRWREPILLLGEILEKDASQALVWQVINARSSDETEFARDFVMACELIEGGASADARSIDALLARARKEVEWTQPAAFKLIRPFIDEFHPRWARTRERPQFQFPLEMLGALGPPAIPFLVQTLRNIPQARNSAARALGRTRSPEIVPPLLELLKHEDPELRNAAALALGEARSPDAVPHLLTMLNDPEVHYSVTGALGKIRSLESLPHLIAELRTHTASYSLCDAIAQFRPDDVLPYLESALNDADDTARDSIVDVLKRIRSPKVVPILITAVEKGTKFPYRAGEAVTKIAGTESVHELCEALKSENAYVREFAAKTLGRIRSTDATMLLISALQDSDEEVCRAAIRALGKIGSSDAIRPLIDLYETGRSRPWILIALGKIGSPESLEYVRNALEGDDSELRLAAAYALKKSDPSLAFPRLLAVLKDKNYSKEVRSVMADALGEMRHTQELQSVLDCLEHEDWRVRLFAAGILGEYKCVETIPYLFKLAHYNYRDVQVSAYEALGTFRSTEAVPYFISGLNDNEVQMVSLRALGEIGDPSSIPHLTKLFKGARNWRWDAADSLAAVLSAENIPDNPKIKKQRIQLLRRVISVLRREAKRSWDVRAVKRWEEAAVRLVELKLALGRYPNDPFKASPGMAKTVMSKASTLLLFMTLAGIVALISLLASGAGDILKGELIGPLKQWQVTHSLWVMLGIVFGLGIVAALLALMFDHIKNRVKESFTRKRN